jgi:hypothetical protein
VVPLSPLLEPATETTVDVWVRNQASEPVLNTEVALVVVDESVLTVTGYDLANPLNTFYPDYKDKEWSKLSSRTEILDGVRKSNVHLSNLCRYGTRGRMTLKWNSQNPVLSFL